MKIKLSFLLLITLLSATGAFAQYEEMRILQTPSEMSKFKALKIKEQLIVKQQDGKETPYMHRFFDTEGRLSREVKGTTKKQFFYDWKNRIIMIQDSVIVNGYYDRDEYEFEFNGYGLLSFSRFPYSNSSFAYDPEKKEMTENTLVDVDAYRIRYYRFNEKSKLIEEEFINADHSREKFRKLVYDTLGNLVHEDIINYGKYGAIDTIKVNYEYNRRKQAIRKTTDEVSLVFPPNFAEEPVIPHTEKISSTYTYDYDDRGNLLEETFSYSDQSFGYRINNEYDDKSLKIKQQNFDINNNLQQTLIFTYKFRK